jgi:hypothetical protein
MLTLNFKRFIFREGNVGDKKTKGKVGSNANLYCPGCGRPIAPETDRYRKLCPTEGNCQAPIKRKVGKPATGQGRSVYIPLHLLDQVLGLIKKDKEK